MLVSTNLIMRVYLYPTHNIFNELTNWIMIATLLSVILALTNLHSTNIVGTVSFGRLAFTHILFELTAVVDFLGICAFWTLLYPGVHVDGKTFV